MAAGITTARSAHGPWAAKPVTIGVAYESGKCDALPHESHDMPLDAVVTESEYLLKHSLRHQSEAAARAAVS